MSNSKTYRQLGNSRQQDMFGVPERELTRLPRAGRGVSFVDPDPDEICHGGKLLRVYLEEMDQGWIVEARGILRRLDWKAFEEAYQGGGRVPYAPAAMMGLILYGVMIGRGSLRELEQLARLDLGATYMSGGIFPDHSVLGRFIQRHTATLSKEFFEQLTRTVLRELGRTPQVLSGDGTIVESAGSRFQSIRLKTLEESLGGDSEDGDSDGGDGDGDNDDAGGDDDKPPKRRRMSKSERRRFAAKVVRKRAKKTRKSQAQKDNTRVNLTDPEATYLKTKRTGYRFGYAVSLLVCEDRFITACYADPSDELSALPPMLDQSSLVCDEPASRILLDANYHRVTTFEACLEHNLDVLCPSRSQASGRPPRMFDKSDFRYDEVTDAVICPEGQRLERKGASLIDPRTGRLSKRYRPPSPTTCHQCPSRPNCTTAKRGRTVARQPTDWMADAVRKAMDNPLAQRRYNARIGSIEPVFGQLRYDQGFDRFHRTGLDGATLETTLQAAAYNLKRYARKAAAAAVAAFIALLSTLVSAYERPPGSFAGRQPGFVSS